MVRNQAGGLARHGGPGRAGIVAAIEMRRAIFDPDINPRRRLAGIA